MRRGRGATVVLGVAAAILLLASATAAVARTVAHRRPSAQALLERVERYTLERGSVRFAGHTETETRSFEGRRDRLPDEQASSFTARATVEGVASFPDRARVVVRSDGFVVELLQMGDRTFTRHAEDGDDVTRQRWVAFDPDEEGLGPAGPEGVTGFDDPAGLREIIADASAAEIVRRDRRVTVVRAAVEIEDSEAFEELDSLRGTTELTAADDGRLDRMVVDVRGEGDDGFTFQARVDFTFSGWGQPVDLEAPAGDELDTTPSIDEEGVAAYGDAPLLQPAAIPERWVLDLAQVVPAEETVEECAEVELDYVDPDDEEAGYLYLFQLPVTCAALDAPTGSQPFRAGPNRGWVTVDPEEGVQAQLVVGRTVVQADTDLVPAELARVLGQLVPLDLSVTPAAIPGIGRARA